MEQYGKITALYSRLSVGDKDRNSRSKPPAERRT